MIREIDRFLSKATSRRNVRRLLEKISLKKKRRERSNQLHEKRDVGTPR